VCSSILLISPTACACSCHVACAAVQHVLTIQPLLVLPAWLMLQVTDAQLQVSAVPGSRFQFRPSTTALSTPSLGAPGLPGLGLSGVAGSYTSRLQGTSLGSKAPGSAGGGSGRGPHTTLSFTPKTVTPVAGAGPRLGADQGVPPPLSSAISA
jgi:hypothetical protein